jgi:hypothetical protein
VQTVPTAAYEGISLMARLTRAVVAAGTALLISVAGVGIAAPANAGGEPCGGMDAPQVVNPGNTAPTLANDTTSAIAGGSRVVNVLANDTDPQGDRLYVVSVTTTGNGQVCVDSDGAIEYFAPSSAASFVDHVTYGVTDGDLYRTATITVHVKGIKPLRARLVHRKTVRHKAQVQFTNGNDVNMTVLAGTPKKRKPLLTRTITPGHTVGFKTKYKKVIFFALVRDSDGLPILVDIGTLNTHTGSQSITNGTDGFLRKLPSARAHERTWLRR